MRILNRNENDTLTDLLTNTTLELKQIVKYLGKYIDSFENTTNVINKFNYGTVNSLAKNNVNHITRRAKVKLFNTYIKSKFSHLLPMIAISGQLETTWTNIRKTIFRDVINFSTFPKESSSIIGLSYYNIIIKPLLKLYEKEEKISSPKHLEFFKEACKTAFKLWLIKESNNTETVKDLIYDFLSNDKFHKLSEFEDKIYKEAAIRLYRNQNIPEHTTNLAKAKLPRILEISSNAPTHFIEGIIKNTLLKKEKIDLTNIKKNLTLTIAQYILIQKIGAFNIDDIERPDPEDLKQIIEYQQLYDLKLEIELNRYKEEIMKETEIIIEEIIKINKNNISEIPTIPQTLINIIGAVRNCIPKTEKSKWYMLEYAMDKFETNAYNKILNLQNNKKPNKIGRPKKNKENTKMDIEIEAMAKFLGLDE